MSPVNRVSGVTESSDNPKVHRACRATVHQVPLEEIVGLAQRDLHSLTPRDVLRLQRVVGNRALVQVQLMRPSRDDRDTDRKRKADQDFIAKLSESVDPEGRTRRAKKNSEKLAGQDAQQLLALAFADLAKNTPPTQLVDDGTMLFSGNRNFGQEFRGEFWGSQGDNPLCGKCGEVIKKKKRSIDHIEPWSIISSYVPTFSVCKDGVHWDVSRDDDAQDVNTNLENLRPTHKKCNSSKGGQKGNDPLIPKRLEDCSGNCGLPKAV